MAVHQQYIITTVQVTIQYQCFSRIATVASLQMAGCTLFCCCTANELVALSVDQLVIMFATLCASGVSMHLTRC